MWLSSGHSAHGRICSLTIAVAGGSSHARGSDHNDNAATTTTATPATTTTNTTANTTGRGARVSLFDIPANQAEYRRSPLLKLDRSDSSERPQLPKSPRFRLCDVSQ